MTQFNAVPESPIWDHPRSPAAARILVDVGLDHGLTAEACLAGTGCCRAELDVLAEVPAVVELTITRNLIRHLGDRPGLGVDAGARFTFGSLGIWGFAVLSSPTVRDVIRVGVRYVELTFAFIRPRREDRGDEVAVICDDREIPADVRSFLVEREFSKIATLLPFTQGPRHAVRLETAFDGRRGEMLRERLSGIDVRTGQPHHALVFDKSILDDPLPQSDPATARVLEQQCAELLEARRKRLGVANRVRSLILADLTGSPTMDRIAADLHVDPRTLRRQLQAEGTSFRELIDEVRATIAGELLSTAALTIEDVANRLGYHDAAGFSRAYRRWTGTTPGRARA